MDIEGFGGRLHFNRRRVNLNPVEKYRQQIPPAMLYSLFASTHVYIKTNVLVRCDHPLPVRTSPVFWREFFV